MSQQVSEAVSWLAGWLAGWLCVWLFGFVVFLTRDAGGGARGVHRRYSSFKARTGRRGSPSTLLRQRSSEPLPMSNGVPAARTPPNVSFNITQDTSSSWQSIGHFPITRSSSSVQKTYVGTVFFQFSSSDTRTPPNPTSHTAAAL